MYKIWCVTILFLCKAIVGLQWCRDDSECYSGAFCNDLRICECGPGKIPSSNAEQCLKLSPSPDYICESDIQCEWIMGPSECRRGVCSCKQNHRYLNDVCVPAKNLNQVCQKSEECYDGKDYNALICKNDKCSCNTGYYERQHRDCRPYANGLNSTCVFDIDCNDNKLLCNNGLCTKINETAIESFEIESGDKYSDLDQTCKDDSNCANIKKSYCVNYIQKCACNRGYAFEKTLGYCVPAIGQKCEESKCDMRNSECVNGVCQCVKNYMTGYLNEKCYKPVRRLNDSCARDVNCFSFGTSGVCVDKKCACADNSWYNKMMFYCEPLSNCTANSDCKAHYTECQNNICACKKGYRFESGQCMPNINTACDKTCGLYHVNCVNHVCTCEDGYLADGDLQCVRKIPNMDSNCTSDVQCQFIMGPLSYCDGDKCSCTNTAQLIVGGVCKLKLDLGDACTRHSECVSTMNSTVIQCRNGVCSCQYGYSASPDRRTCLADTDRHLSAAVANVPLGAAVLLSLCYAITSLN